MAHTRHATFLEHDPASFEAYAESLIQEHPTQEERQRIFAYLNYVLAMDEKTLADVATKRSRSRSNRKVVDRLLREATLDFSKNGSLFSQTVLSDAQVAALLQLDNSHVFCSGRTLPSVQIDGDNVTLDGQGTAGGSAKLGTLAPGATIAGSVLIQGSNVVIRNMTIAPPSGTETFKFSGPCDGIVVENCIFDGTNTEGIWWYGDNQLSGNVTIRNCHIKNYTNHWLTLDLTTHSNTPVTKLDTVIFEECKLDNISSSLSIRGKASEPTDVCIFRNNEINYGGVHAAFWSAIEINNCAFVDVSGNRVTGMSRIAGNGRGFLQTWSNSPALAGNWTVRYTDNHCPGFDFGIQSANGTGFFALNPFDPDYLVHSDAGELGDTTYGMSNYFSAGSWFAGAWGPENIADRAAPGATDFADKPNFTP